MEAGAGAQGWSHSSIAPCHDTLPTATLLLPAIGIAGRYRLSGRTLQDQCLAMLSICTIGIFNLPWGLGISLKTSIIFPLKLYQISITMKPS